MPRSLHLRRRPHPVRPLRRRAVRASAPTTSPRSSMRAIVERTGIDPAPIDDVIFGDANQAGEDNRNVARFGALLAGLARRGARGRP